MVIQVCWQIYLPTSARTLYVLRRLYTVSRPDFVAESEFGTIPTDDPLVFRDKGGWMSSSVDELRNMLPRGLVRIGDPDPGILEVWI